MRKIKYSKKNVLIILFTIIILVGIILYGSFSFIQNNIITPNKLKQNELSNQPLKTGDYKRLRNTDVPGFQTELEFINQYTIQNQLIIDTSNDVKLVEYYYEFDPIFFDEVAIKLNLDTYSFIEENGEYLWSKSNEPNLTTESDQIYINLNSGLIKFNIKKGIDASLESSELLPNQIFDIFGFSMLDSLKFDLIPNLPDGLLSYTGTIDDKILLGSGADKILISLKINKNNRLQSGYFYFMPLIPNLKSDTFEVTSFSKIDGSTIQNMRKKFIYSEDLQFRSQTGKLLGVTNLPLRVKLENYSPSYISYYDYNLGIIKLIPALNVTGNFVDTKNNIGSCRLVIINAIY